MFKIPPIKCPHNKSGGCVSLVRFIVPSANVLLPLAENRCTLKELTALAFYRPAYRNPAGDGGTIRRGAEHDN